MYLEENLPEEVAVPIGDIVMREDWQVRTAMNDSTIKRYASTMRTAGGCRLSVLREWTAH